MALTLNDVGRLAKLARLAPSPDQQATLLTQLNGLFEHVEAMRAVDTTGEQPLYTPLSAVDIFVKDLGIVLDMARASKFPLPLSSTAPAGTASSPGPVADGADVGMGSSLILQTGQLPALS